MLLRKHSGIAAMRISKANLLTHAESLFKTRSPDKWQCGQFIAKPNVDAICAQNISHSPCARASGR